ncbi:MAG: hypothetical protein ACXAC2_23770, partial [Candidatus Kariarchaeaceae archaeon]
EKLKLTSAAIKYRVERLTSSKLITKFTIKIDKSILTPSYQAYHVSMNVNPIDLEINYKLLRNSRLFERIIHIASSFNLIGITIPLSNKDMKNIIDVISNKSVLNYTMIPIINDFQDLVSPTLYGEQIEKLYCPECQEEIKSDAFIEKVVNKEFGFCCRECRDSFSDKYTKIVN